MHQASQCYQVRMLGSLTISLVCTLIHLLEDARAKVVRAVQNWNRSLGQGGCKGLGIPGLCGTPETPDAGH